MGGLVIGSWGIVARTVDAFSWIPDVTGMRNHVPGVWARLRLMTAIGTAEIEFDGSRSRTRTSALKVERLHPDPATWLRQFFTGAGRKLDAYGQDIPSADVAWRVARLRLLFDDGDGATAAVDQGLDHLRTTGAVDTDADDLRKLDVQLRACGRFGAADRLRRYLDKLPG